VGKVEEHAERVSIPGRFPALVGYVNANRFEKFRFSAVIATENRNFSRARRRWRL
jgi:hypothetical protein